MTTTLKIDGMTCQNCVRHVREAIQSVNGINYATVDLDQAGAVAHWKEWRSRREGIAPGPGRCRLSGPHPEGKPG